MAMRSQKFVIGLLQLGTGGLTIEVGGDEGVPMSIDHDSAKPTRCQWVVYYDGRLITITSWYVDTPTGRYPTAELSDVLRVHTYEHHGRSVALIAGGMEIVLSLPFAMATHSLATLLAGVIAAAGVGAGILADSRRNPRWLELRAYCGGDEVTLFRSRSLAEFERVRWALIRALEVDAGPLELD
jgi:hypothetical protein